MSTSALNIRPCTLDDDEITLALFQRAVREIASRDYTPAQIEAWIDGIALPTWAAVNAQRRMWIAMLDDVPAGFTDLTNEGHLDRLFVSPDYQRCGVASALLDMVEQAARQRGMTRLTTDASLTALPFFETRGFVVTRARQVERRGQALDNFQMKKRLEGIEGAF
ncbi:acetyltransferase [Kushneria pakistanensis]|uniref:Acetyltransferase n=1 Tax=Kushneria pakistanensis TaxID=1508770 RepID=A0ABQ3FAD6_9GAMM|nr:GNAT family N-acetyltransferase [Kushneria pakistanensis]GHC15494.1 acetyltransferase [Kushneria pakistanensis]